MTDVTTCVISSDAAMRELGRRIGAAARGGEVLELAGDVGAGKTTFTKGLALGMHILEPIQSPTFTISRMYDTPHALRLAHYDFYRLNEAGIMSDELHETLHEPTTVTVVEWAGIVQGVLPKDHVEIKITATAEMERRCEIVAHGERSRQLLSRADVC